MEGMRRECMFVPSISHSFCFLCSGDTDSDASVEREVHRLIKTVESHLSEPLSAYLQA